MEEPISVSVRIRPLGIKETETGQKEAWKIIGEDTIQAASEQSSLSHRFDNVFGAEVSTDEVFEQVGEDVVSSVLKGMNGTIFAYGQTASGKTHTMEGDEIRPGLLTLAVEKIWDDIAEMPHFQFLIRVSYIEVFKEKVQDLLSDGESKLRIREDPKEGFYVENLSSHSVISIEEILELKRKGEKRRHVEETNMNLRSSRSHTIFTLTIEMKDTRVFEENNVHELKYKKQRSNEVGDFIDTSTANDYCFGVLVGKLNLVDLAGSENAKLTGAAGDRLAEAAKINCSLLSLSRVISQLSSSTSSTPFVNWRDSKLTQILQPSLGGNCRTTVICCIRAGDGFFEESKSTLSFAAKTKQIKNTVRVNEVLDGEGEMQKLKNTVRNLENQLKVQQEENEAKQSLQKEIVRLKAFLINGEVAGDDKSCVKRKKHRETWCPGKANAPRISFAPQIHALANKEFTQKANDRKSLNFAEDIIFEDSIDLSDGSVEKLDLSEDSAENDDPQLELEIQKQEELKKKIKELEDKLAETSGELETRKSMGSSNFEMTFDYDNLTFTSFDAEQDKENSKNISNKMSSGAQTPQKNMENEKLKQLLSIANEEKMVLEQKLAEMEEVNKHRSVEVEEQIKSEINEKSGEYCTVEEASWLLESDAEKHEIELCVKSLVDCVHWGSSCGLFGIQQNEDSLQDEDLIRSLSDMSNVAPESILAQESMGTEKEIETCIETLVNCVHCMPTTSPTALQEKNLKSKLRTVDQAVMTDEIEVSTSEPTDNNYLEEDNVLSCLNSLTKIIEFREQHAVEDIMNSPVEAEAQVSITEDAEKSLISTLKLQLAEEQKKKDALQETEKNLLSNLDQIQNRIILLEEDAASLRNAKLEEIEELKAELEESRSQYEIKVESLEQKLLLNAERQENSSTNSKLLSQLRITVDLKTQELEKAKAELLQKEKDLNDALFQIEKASEQSEAKDKKSEKSSQIVENELARTKSKLEQRKIEIDNFKIREEKLAEKLKLAEKEKAQIQQDLDDINAMEKKNEDLDVLVDSYKTTVDALEKKNSVLKTESSERLDIIKKLENDLHESSRELFELKNTVTNDTCGKCEKHEIEIADLLEAKEGLKYSVRANEKKIISTYNSIKLLEQDKAELETRLQRAIGLREKSEDVGKNLRSQVESLSLKLEASEGLLTENQSLKERLTNLENKLEEAEVSNENHSEEAIMLKKEIEQKNQRIEKLERTKLTERKAIKVRDAFVENKRLKLICDQAVSFIKHAYKVEDNFTASDIKPFLKEINEGMMKHKEVQEQYKVAIQKLKKKVESLSSSSLSSNSKQIKADLKAMEMRNDSMAATVSALEEENLKLIKENKSLKARSHENENIPEKANANDTPTRPSKKEKRTPMSNLKNKLVHSLGKKHLSNEETQDSAGDCKQQ